MGSEKKVVHPEPEEIGDDECKDQIVEKKQKKLKKKKKKETLNVTIQTIGEQPDKISPLVGYFPTSFDPLKNASAEEHDVKVYRNVKRNNRLQLVVSPNGSDANFVGTNYSGEAAAPQLCAYALGVLDKDTHTLKIFPIAANKIFRLEPKIGGSDGTQVEDQESLKSEVDAEEKADKLRRLDDMFSTKKTKKRNEKLQSLRQKQDPKCQEDLDTTLKEVKINTESVEAVATTNTRNIPFHDMSASTPEKAYPLEKIIDGGEWDYLKDLVNMSQGEVTPDVYPNFVCYRVHKLENIKDSFEVDTVACVLQYITHLIKFKDKFSMNDYKYVKNHKFPSILSQKFRAMFGDSDSKRLSDEKRNLLISYVLVLTLYVDGYRSDPSDIAKDLRMNPIELRTHYEQLACKFVREKTVLLATLPVPLKFPVFRNRKRQR